MLMLQCLIASYIQPPGKLLKSSRSRFLPEGSWACRLGCGRIEVSVQVSNLVINCVGRMKQQAAEKITFGQRLFWCSSYVWCNWTLFDPKSALSSIRGVLRLEAISYYYPNSISRLAIGINWAVLVPQNIFIIFQKWTKKMMKNTSKRLNSSDSMLALHDNYELSYNMLLYIKSAKHAWFW